MFCCKYLRVSCFDIYYIIFSQNTKGIQISAPVLHLDDLPHVQPVRLPVGVDAVVDLIRQAFPLEGRLIQLFAHERQVRFLEGHAACQFLGRQARLSHLVAVAAGVRAEVAQRWLVRRREEAHGEGIAVLDEIPGVAVGVDVHHGDGTTPERAQAAPTDGAGL